MPKPTQKKKVIKGWAVARKKDSTLFDDGCEYTKRHSLYFYPLFKKKLDAQLYIRKTFLQFKFGRNIAKVVPVEITYIIPTKQ